MSDIKMSVCGSCGFKWPTGQHGEHSCSSYLVTENASLKARVDELVFSLDDRDCYIADADMKNSGLQARIAELETALTNIKKHQEAVIVGMPQLSSVWQIASKALEK